MTAAEDHLIKVFSSHSGQLLYTLKGHRSAINDIGLDSSDQVSTQYIFDRSINVCTNVVFYAASTY